MTSPTQRELLKPAFMLFDTIEQEYAGAAKGLAEGLWLPDNQNSEHGGFAALFDQDMRMRLGGTFGSPSLEQIQLEADNLWNSAIQLKNANPAELCLPVLESRRGAILITIKGKPFVLSVAGLLPPANHLLALATVLTLARTCVKLAAPLERYTSTLVAESKQDLLPLFDLFDVPALNKTA